MAVTRLAGTPLSSTSPYYRSVVQLSSIRSGVRGVSGSGTILSGGKFVITGAHVVGTVKADYASITVYCYATGHTSRVSEVWVHPSYLGLNGDGSISHAASSYDIAVLRLLSPYESDQGLSISRNSDELGKEFIRLGAIGPSANWAGGARYSTNRADLYWNAEFGYGTTISGTLIISDRDNGTVAGDMLRNYSGVVPDLGTGTTEDSAVPGWSGGSTLIGGHIIGITSAMSSTDLSFDARVFSSAPWIDACMGVLHRYYSAINYEPIRFGAWCESVFGGVHKFTGGGGFQGASTSNGRVRITDTKALSHNSVLITSYNATHFKSGINNSAGLEALCYMGSSSTSSVGAIIGATNKVKTLNGSLYIGSSNIQSHTNYFNREHKAVGVVVVGLRSASYSTPFGVVPHFKSSGYISIWFTPRLVTKMRTPTRVQTLARGVVSMGSSGGISQYNGSATGRGVGHASLRSSSTALFSVARSPSPHTAGDTIVMSSRSSSSMTLAPIGVYWNVLIARMEFQALCIVELDMQMVVGFPRPSTTLSMIANKMHNAETRHTLPRMGYTFAWTTSLALVGTEGVRSHFPKLLHSVNIKLNNPWVLAARLPILEFDVYGGLSEESVQISAHLGEPILRCAWTADPCVNANILLPALGTVLSGSNSVTIEFGLESSLAFYFRGQIGIL